MDVCVRKGTLWLIPPTSQTCTSMTVGMLDEELALWVMPVTEHSG